MKYFNYSWGELRTLNADKLIRAMASNGKQSRITFHTTSNVETKWVIMPIDEVEDMEAIKKELENLKTKMDMIVKLSTL